MKKLLSAIGVLLGICFCISLAYCQSISEDQEKEIYKYMLHQERLMAQSDTGENMGEVFSETADTYNISAEEARSIYNRGFYRPKSDQEEKIANRMREKYASLPESAAREDYYRVGKEIMDEFGINEDEFFEIEKRNFAPPA